MSRLADILAAADGLMMLAAGAVAARLIARQRDHDRLYGGSRRVRLRWPRRRVPGAPRDGMLTGEEAAAMAEIEAAWGQPQEGPGT